ncbi:MAG: DUF354 domain-containing protein [Candidatus Heimdallarchaeota archaeon]|nr:DUF354 domain-containing protein [Candidatus Heimdallarchaeota archaeon]
MANNNNNKTIWFEALTAKQAMLFLAIGKRLEQVGFDIIYTTRDYDYIRDIFKHQNVQPKVIGTYGGKTLEEKLLASARRVVLLAEFISQLPSKPIVSISFSSPDASRVAFGLAIPLILLNDTSHSTAVGKLTFSLAKHLIIPECLKRGDFIQLGAQPQIITQYAGVDEVEYLSGKNYEEFLKLRKAVIQKTDDSHRYLIFRPEENFAAYMKDPDKKPYLEILQEIVKCYDKKILVFPRYPQQKKEILQKFKGEVVIPVKGLSNLELYATAEVAVTGGGTMGREAALLGIPSITYFWRHLEPQIYIENKGFPSYSIQNIQNAKKIIRKICSDPLQYWANTRDMINQLEKPSDVLIPLLKRDNEIGQYFK